MTRWRYRFDLEQHLPIPNDETTSDTDYGIISSVDSRDLSGQRSLHSIEPAASRRLIGLQGRLSAHPYHGLMGAWAVLCGAVASNHFRLSGEDLLALTMVLLLTGLGWGSLWDLTVHAAWFLSLRTGRASARPIRLVGLPYVQPNAPGGRLIRWLGRLFGWWREVLWPVAGSALLGILAAAVLTTVLGLLLPDRLYPLNLAVLGLIGLGMIQRRRGRAVLGAHALVLIGLGWLAGHAAFAEVSRLSAILAACFTLSSWGTLRAVEGQPGGLWLSNGGQVTSIVLLLAVVQPLAAGLAGLFLCAQLILQPSLRSGDRPTREKVSNLIWPWLAAGLLVAALAVP